MCDMKASNAAPTLPVPNPEDWCTVAYAAERLNRSERTVRRMAAEKVLRIYSPRVATNRAGSDRIHLCWLPEVEQVRDALMRAGRLINKTGWRRGERRSAQGQAMPDPRPSHMAVRAGLTTTPH